MPKPIRTAVFPVAGRGTRFLPITKASPKEMLPIVDKPLIQYAVEEAVAAGAENLVFVTGSEKRAIEDHFDSHSDLENALEKKGDLETLEMVRSIVPSGAHCIYIRQPAPLGLGHAVLCAKPVVEDEPFYVHLADDLIKAEVPVLAQMRESYEIHGNSIIAVQDVDPSETGKYGIVDVEDADAKLTAIRSIVEKPDPVDAPSTLAVVGRYLLTPGIIDKLETIGRGAGGEIQLTDAIAALLADETAMAYEFDGIRYDCGNKLGYLEATVEYALDHPLLGWQFEAYLEKLIKRRSSG